MKKKYTVGSLYAGVGGICSGFINSGFKVEWANEFDKNACITYRENFNHTLYEGDVMKLNIDKMKKIDVLAGGFPCQPFFFVYFYTQLFCCCASFSNFFVFSSLSFALFL